MKSNQSYCYVRGATARRLTTILSLAVASSGANIAAARNDHFAPVGNEFRVNANTGYNQFWCRVAIQPDASLIGFSYTSGQEASACQFTIQGAPVTGVLAGNPNITSGIQDETETSFAIDGRQLIAFNDRVGHDGEQNGIYGRIFLPGGTAIGPEFQINQIWQASQWRPLVVAHPSGGWLVAWTGDWDGDAFFRLVNSDGTFRTNDILVNNWDNGGQVDTAPAIAPDGTSLLVFVDFSGYSGSGNGTNLWGRLFDSNGVALQAAAWPLNTPAYWSLDQREPRAIADGLGNFIVVWEDTGNDGSGWGIFGRRFSTSGVPLGPEFLANTTTAGDQRTPRVAADGIGNFIVCWEDWSTGQSDITAQRFDVSGQKVGTEFIVNTTLVGDQHRPSVAMTPTTGHVVFSFDGPAIMDDCFARIYTTYQAPETYCTAKINSLGCSPAVSWSGTPSSSGADDFHVQCGQTLNNKNGLMFWGSAAAALPFHGGLLCVQQPVQRTPLQFSGGSPSGDDCTGSFDFFFSHAYMQSHGFSAGDTVYAQHWSRDPGFAPPDNRSLSNALSFDVTP